MQTDISVASNSGGSEGAGGTFESLNKDAFAETNNLESFPNTGSFDFEDSLDTPTVQLASLGESIEPPISLGYILILTKTY